MDAYLENKKQLSPEFFSKGTAFAKTCFKNAVHWDKTGKLLRYTGVFSSFPKTNKEIKQFLGFFMETGNMECLKELEEEGMGLEPHLSSYMAAFSEAFLSLLEERIKK